MQHSNHGNHGKS